MDVTLEDVRVQRGGRLVLDVPFLRLRGGRTTAVLGPNGAGKTTLLRTIAGLERPCEGRIVVDGAGAKPRLNVAFVFQDDVFLRRSVRENLELALRLQQVNKDEIGRRIDEVADLVGIKDVLGRRADHLSGGEGRRVSLARALCLRAPIALLDEPLAGLDEPTYSRLLSELPQLLRAFRATTVLVTHHRREAFRLAEDLVVLAAGKVLASGDKRDVATNPGITEVASVLGYIVLTLAGRRVAVPPSALKLGPGSLRFEAIVEDTLDLVEYRTIVGRIGDLQVHVALQLTEKAPARGEHVVVHADRFYELT